MTGTATIAKSVRKGAAFRTLPRVSEVEMTFHRVADFDFISKLTNFRFVQSFILGHKFTCRFRRPCRTITKTLIKNVEVCRRVLRGV